MKKLTIIAISLLAFTIINWCIADSYTQELETAYNWAYSKWITTQSTIDKANMKGKITREEMAKMISNYAINVLWMIPDTTRSCFFLDSNINPDLVEYVTKSCQLWLMGQWVSSFRPKDNVTRAEFWTLLSRALWWNQNEWWITYYQNHLKALKAEWIMNNISFPMDKEIRWYVMLMLMRSFQVNYYIIDENDEKYPEWCNTPWLKDPERRCILAMYADNSKNSRWSTKSWTMLVAPFLSEKVVEWIGVSEFCNSLDILWASWESPASHEWARSYMVNNYSKINNLIAKWSSKPGHYWADLKVNADINCRIDWACGKEDSNKELSVRCVSRDNVDVLKYQPKLVSDIKYPKIDNQISEVLKMVE